MYKNNSYITVKEDFSSKIVMKTGLLRTDLNLGQKIEKVKLKKKKIFVS